MGIQLSDWVENIVGKREIAHNGKFFFFFCSDATRHVFEDVKNEKMLVTNISSISGGIFQHCHSQWEIEIWDSAINGES